MKNRKNRIRLLIVSMLLVIGLVGCGKTPSVDVSDEIQKPSDEILKPSEEIPQPTDTESLEDKALLAYQDILKAAPAIEGKHEELNDASFSYEQNLKLFGKHYDSFAIADINQDNIPELVAFSMVNFRWTIVYVYTYLDGEAVLVNNQLDKAAVGTFEQRSTANGAFITYICEENHIHSVWRGKNPIGEALEENHAYELAGTTLILVDCTNADTSMIFQ